jgi:hypothetical protein
LSVLCCGTLGCTRAHRVTLCSTATAAAAAAAVAFINILKALTPVVTLAAGVLLGQEPPSAPVAACLVLIAAGTAVATAQVGGAQRTCAAFGCNAGNLRLAWGYIDNSGRNGSAQGDLGPCRAAECRGPARCARQLGRARGPCDGSKNCWR